MKKSFIIYLFLTLSVVLYAQQHRIKVACIGNSITYGYGLPDRVTRHIRCNYRKCWESPIKLKTSVSPVLRC